jgi:hypothetical protein
MTDRLEIISKTIDGQQFTGLRLYLYLPVTYQPQDGNSRVIQVQGPFMHRDGDDDSSAVTFWGKRDLREVLRKALALLDDHYAKPRTVTAAPSAFSDDGLQAADEARMLSAYAHHADTGEWKGLFSYPGCARVLFTRGWLSDDGKITEAGRAALDWANKNFAASSA